MSGIPKWSFIKVGQHLHFMDTHYLKISRIIRVLLIFLVLQKIREKDLKYSNYNQCINKNI